MTPQTNPFEDGSNVHEYEIAGHKDRGPAWINKADFEFLESVHQRAGTDKLEPGELDRALALIKRLKESLSAGGGISPKS
ncbi:hypothetical protein COT97_01480 [Candidatus Falkowbacteria bacterium CG10_big_fil_rev_8_21_14_0_10_39_11]|uniref:Uncharacterized protein n=1 Tax=Candidatus Falkowbacteria bacterium CG10_big_fil_rev_8_21_14_0_10_39_11 TaxID=1974565 RepID=A0A2H0V7I8_9BACT|nr:MAG: hypothetical protein COT97_01480 [Candidatus Falkowbacteria bacterium CG10_big_fil_rev_8_21_14_0_10_39_11]